jgi:hypothetical protein
MNVHDVCYEEVKLNVLGQYFVHWPTSFLVVLKFGEIFFIFILKYPSEREYCYFVFSIYFLFFHVVQLNRRKVRLQRVA